MENIMKTIQQEEQDRIYERRKAADVSRGDPIKDSIGLALSGGGIRSATFSLGILQAMSRVEFLKYVDYLSTVSGGGYIGSSLTWFMTKLKETFPFGTSRKDSEAKGAEILYWLRNHGKYLTPGDGMNVWSLIAAVLTGVLVNLAVLVPLFTLLFRLLTRDIGIGASIMKMITMDDMAPSPSGIPIFSWLFILGLLLICVYLLQILFFALTSRLDSLRGFIAQRILRRHAGKILMFAIFFLIIGTIPFAYDFLAANIKSWTRTIMSSVSLSGIVAIWGALFRREEGSETAGFRSFLLSFGLTLLVYGLFLWLYHWVHADTFDVRFLIYGVPLSLIIAIAADINHVSMHRFYRNRLMEAYFPFKLMEKDYKSADQCLMKDLEQTKAPYHIVCANIQTIGSDDPKLRERGGDSFIFSPLYAGSTSTDYIKTKKYIGGNMNLATAMAISGAAVDANTYATRSRPLSFLMALLNIRLGYWIANPKCYERQIKWLRPMWYVYLFAELLGLGLREDRRSIHLSDGGHFENLGLYELIRRRCRLIIVCDGACDLNYNFGDLAKCIEMVRVDFGAKIEIDVRPMRADKKTGISPQPYQIGHITYRDDSEGWLLYIKSALIEHLSEDIYAYHRQFKEFPNQSTGDQFFDERQFEAYRELGFLIGQRTFGDIQCDSFNAMIGSLQNKGTSTTV